MAIQTSQMLAIVWDQKIMKPLKGISVKIKDCNKYTIISQVHFKMNKYLTMWVCQSTSPPSSCICPFILQDNQKKQNK